MSRRKRRRKAQRSPEKYLQSSIRVVDAGVLGRRPKPFHQDTAIDSFRSWVYAAVMLNANAVAATPLRLYVRKRASGLKLWDTRKVPSARKRYLLHGAQGLTGPVAPHRETTRKLLELGDDFEEITSAHPVLRLMRDVNPWFNGFDLMQLITIYLELTGNAYLHPVINVLGVPGELWPMPSQWTWVQPSREQFIEGYVYGHGQENQLFFTPDEVLHFRTANPGRDGLFYGMGKVEAGWGAVSLNEAQHEMDNAMAQNMGRPDYAVVIKSGASNDQLDRFERRIEQQLRGTRNAGKFLSITGDVDLKPLNFPPKDIVGREDTVEEIAAVFGVPVSLLKANDPNLSNARSGFASWRSNSVLPLTSLIEGKLNERLLPLYGIEGDTVLAFDNPVPADEEFQLREHAQLVGFGIMTRNEARGDRGLDPVEGGDDLLVQGGLVPIENIEAMSDMQLDPFGRIGFGGMNQGGIGMPRLPSLQTGGSGADDLRTPGTPQLSLTADEIKEAVRDGLIEMAKADESMRNPDDSGREMPSTDQCVRRRTIALIEAGVDPDTAVQRAREECGASTRDEDSGGSNGGGSSDPRGPGGPNLSAQGPLGAQAQNSMRSAIWKAWDKAKDSDLPQLPESQAMPGFIKQIELVLNQMIGSVERSLRRARGGSTASQIVALLTERSWQARIAKAAEQFLGEAVELGGRNGARKIMELEELPEGFDFGFDVSSPSVNEFVENWSVRLGDEVTEHVQKRLSATLADGIQRGESMSELTARVREWAGKHDPERGTAARAERIARTESARAYMAGEAIAWRESGVVQGKAWVLAPDACEFCRATEKAFQGKHIGVEEPYYELGAVVKGAEGGTMSVNYSDVYGPPLHPNCRCDLLPVLKAEDS